MSATAGWKARVRVPGAAVAFTNEATTANGARTQYQITNTAKRVFDPQIALAVQTSPDGTTWTTAGAALYTINRLTGTIIFNAAQAVGTQVRFSTGSYLPLSTVAGAHGYSFTITAGQLDASDFDGLAATSGFAASKLTSQYDATGTLSQWDQRDTFFANALLNATVLVLELMPDRSATVPDFLVWALLDKEQLQTSLTTLNETSLDWTGVHDADGRVVSG